MIIIQECNHLTEDQIRQIREVEAVCHAHDQLTRKVFLDTSMNFDPAMKTSFLLYVDDKLVSFLSIFCPLSHEAEISAYTLPAYRFNGYFATLLQRAIAELKRHQVTDMLLVAEAQSESGKAAIDTLDAYLDFTEYVLRYDHSTNATIQTYPYRLQLMTPTLAELDTLVSMNQAIYGDSAENARSMTLRTLESDGKKQYAVLFEGQMIGIGATNVEDGEVSIYGLGTVPEMQGRGFGKELLFLILQDLLAQNYPQITLEVNSRNARAYQLYTKYGFVVETAFDYYRKRIR